MSYKSPTVYVDHILECIEDIEQCLHGYMKDNFIEDKVVQAAVLRNLQVMCESTQKLPEHLKLKYASVKWRIISDFRNVLVHDYFGIDYESIWKTIEIDLPALKQVILQMKQELIYES